MTLVERVASERRAEEIKARISRDPVIYDVFMDDEAAIDIRSREERALAYWHAPGPQIDRR